MSHPTDLDPAAPGSSTKTGLEATGSSLPVWDRLPVEPPQADGPFPVAPYVGPTTEELPISSPAPTVAPAISPSPMERRSRGWFQTILAGVLGAVLAVGALQIIDDDPATTAGTQDPTAAPAAVSDSEAPTQPPATLGIGNDAAGDAVAIGAAVIPSIVTVQVGSQSAGGILGTGSGSGVIIDSAGYIVTNEHVVSVGSAFEVVLSDGRTTYEATLVGADPLTDLAVLKIDAAGLTPIALGDTSSLQVGDPTVAVGSPLGLQGGPSLTVGVVSAFDRIVEAGGSDPLYGMLQTDAPITQGSSGGALVDGLGRLIGITTAVGVSEVGIEGIGFATPVELMKRVTDELIATGTVSHAFLGIFGGTSFSTAADGARIAAGVEVSSVEPDSAAFAAGLRTGNMITAVDGEQVTTMEDLIMTLRYMSAGDAVTLTVDAATGSNQLDVVLGTR